MTLIFTQTIGQKAGLYEFLKQGEMKDLNNYRGNTLVIAVEQNYKQVL